MGKRPPRLNIKAHATRELSFGSESINLSFLPQIVDASQTRTIGAALSLASEQGYFETESIIDALKRALGDIESKGLSSLRADDLAEIRLQELAAALNRLRSLQIR